MIKTLLFIISILLCTYISGAQQSKIDSLQKLLNSTTDYADKAAYLTKLGFIHHQLDIDKALEYHQRALEIWKRKGNKKNIAYSLINIAAVYSAQGKPEKALKCYLESLKILEEIGDKESAGYTMVDIGHIHKNQRHYDQALEYFEKSLVLQEEIHNDRGIAFAMNNIGSIYHWWQQQDTALLYYSNALKIREKIGDKEGIAVSSSCMGLIYNDQKQTQKALECFLRSLQNYEEINDLEGIANTLNDIGTIYRDNGDYEKGLVYAEKSFVMARKLGYPENIKRAAQLLSELFALQKDFQKAYEFYMLFSLTKDSLLNVEGSKLISEMSTKYETEKKENKIKLLEKDKIVSDSENKRQRYLMLLMAAVAIAIGLVLFVVFRSLKITRKQKTVIEEQKKTVEEKNKNITDSINYAQRIQNAILPSIDLIYATLKESFILYKPKDVVSGDFYFFAQKENQILLGAIDCTGHGVPGAFMSMIGHDQLNHIIIEKGITQPAEILNELNKGIKHALKQSGNQNSEGESKDGMDVALVSLKFNEENSHCKLQYAGANRPLYIISDKKLNEIKADKTAIAGHTKAEYHFTHHEVELKKEDAIYLFSDGFYDQFGGPKSNSVNGGKKLMTKKFKEILISIQDKPMKEQEKHLNTFVENWMAGNEQVDDILVIGVRL